METFDVTIEKRTMAGKPARRDLKERGLIPGILYNKDENIPVSLEAHQMKTMLDKHGKDVFLNLSLNGTHIKAKIQEVQRDPVNQDIKHIDLIPAADDGIPKEMMH